MASQITMSSNAGFTTVSDSGFTPTDVAGPLNVNDYTALQDIGKMDSLLATLNGTYWTTNRLGQESIWDKLFWLRATRKSSSALT